jgi:hypothetical protein
MTDLIEDIRAVALDTEWEVRDISKDVIEKAGFEKGVTITSPENDLMLEVMSSAKEVFCNFGSYGRFEVPISAGNYSKARARLLSILGDVFKYGVTIDVYKRGSKLLRSIVLT